MIAQEVTDFTSHDLKFSHEIEAELAEGKISTNRAGWYYTYIGEYAKAMKCYELPASWGYDTLLIDDTSKWKLVDAFRYIAKEAKEHRVVIVSEAHHKPQHRIFTRLLLDTLSKIGFTDLGMEALNNLPGIRDSLLNQRGFALNSPVTGTYTREPQMANLIRIAIEKKYSLFSFERTSRKMERDSQMAQNIISYLKDNPDKKLLLHCGWHHAVEAPLPKGKRGYWMAYLLKQAGIDPLTIYQDILSEKYLEKESPIYTQLSSEKIAILIDQRDSPHSPPIAHPPVDLQVYHPRTRYIQGRPHWLFAIDENQIVDVPRQQIQITYPVIVRAILKKEYPYGVPVDIIELQHHHIDKKLVLSPGSYTIQLFNTKGEEQTLDLVVPHKKLGCN